MTIQATKTGAIVVKGAGVEEAMVEATEVEVEVGEATAEEEVEGAVGVEDAEEGGNFIALGVQGVSTTIPRVLDLPQYFLRTSYHRHCEQQILYDNRITLQTTSLERKIRPSRLSYRLPSNRETCTDFYPRLDFSNLISSRSLLCAWGILVILAH